jgi:hypothetical protein
MRTSPLSLSKLMLVAVAIGLVLPMVASAQRGGRSGGGGGGGSAVAVMSKKDVEELDPVKLILEKKKDIKIDEAQKVQIEAMYKPLNKTFDSLFKIVDKAQFDGQALRKNSAGDQSIATRLKICDANQVTQKAYVELREAYTKGGADVLAILRDDQKAKANEILGEQKKLMAASTLGRARLPGTVSEDRGNC